MSHIDFAHTLCEHASRDLYLLIREPVPWQMAHLPWLEPVKAWLLAHENHHLQVVVEQDRACAQQLPALTRLGQRLTSKIDVTALNNLPASIELPKSFLCNHQHHILSFSDHQTDELWQVTDEPARNRSLIEDFSLISRYGRRSKYFRPVII